MTMSRVLAVCAACYVAGVLTQAGLAQGKKPAFDPAIFEGSAPAVGTKLLDGALALAEQGSWERIAVGRAWYLGGDKAMAMNADDDSAASVAFANLNNDRAKAEGLFRTAMQKKPKEFWHWVNAGGWYLGVKPQ